MLHTFFFFFFFFLDLSLSLSPNRYSFLSKATFQKRKNIGYIIFYRGSHILIWAIQLICCLFQYKVGVYYLSQALKMILITFILLFWLFGGVFFGYKIYAMLAAAEKKFGVPSDTTSKDASARKRSQKKKSSIRQHNSATPTPTPTPGSKSQNDLSQHASSSNNIHSNLNTASNNTQSTMHDDTEDEAQHNNVAVQDPEPGIRSKKRIKAIRKIYNLLKALLVIVFLCVAATTYSFITALSNKTDLDTNSFEPPVGFGDLISNGAFDIIQYVALCVVVINYRVTKLSISTTTKKAKAAAARALISFHQDNKKDPKAEDEDNRASYPMTENPTASSNVLLSNKSGLSINISTTRLDLSENESDDTKYRASFQAKMQEQKAQQQEQQQQQTQQKLEQKSEQPASVSPTSASASTNTDALSSTPMASSLLSGVPSPLSEADELRDVVLEIPQEVRDSTD